MRIITLVGVASLVVACAASDHIGADKPPGSTTSANAYVAVASGTSSTPGATTAASATSSAAQAETVDQNLVKRGYRPHRLNGQLRYCLTQTLTGTHFSNGVCLTRDQIEANDKNTKRDVDTINRAHEEPLCRTGC